MARYNYGRFFGYGESDDIEEKEDAIDEIEETEEDLEEGSSEDEGFSDLDEVDANIEEAEAEEDAQYDDAGDPLPGTEAEEYQEEQNGWDAAVATPEGSDVPMDVEFIESTGESMMAEGQDMLDLVGPADDDGFNQVVIENDEGIITLPNDDGDLVTQSLEGFDSDEEGNDNLEFTSLDSDDPYGLDEGESDSYDDGGDDYPEDNEDEDFIDHSSAMDDDEF